MDRRIVFAQLADRGVWISDDRVNAFVNRRGLAEIGYHGTQPVSRNSRILSAPSGVLCLWIRGRNGVWKRATFPEARCTSSTVEMRQTAAGLRIQAHGRSIDILVTCSQPWKLVFEPASLLTNVHGQRTWNRQRVLKRAAEFRMRDRIGLHAWIRRTGLYAGDFLIPEPMRRHIFSSSRRSGFATIEDLKPEFLSADPPIYNAEVFVRMGGNSVKISGRSNAVVIEPDPPGVSTRVITVSFRDRRQIGSVRKVQAQNDHPPSDRPLLHLPGYPNVESFFNEAPDVLSSCVVQELGMPRACAGAYYWIWAWDSLASAMEWSLTGELDRQRDVLRFVDAHRDEGGGIPARWTRDLQPLDTPPRGALDALFAILLHEYVRQSGDRGTLASLYPSLVRHYEEMSACSDREGMFATTGFYPDLLTAFGRTDDSAVAMETGLHFDFCRTLSELARELGDTTLSVAAGRTAGRIRAGFLRRFHHRGFLIDSFDLRTGRRNMSHPLFSLIFLRSHFGWELIEPAIGDLSGFISRRHAGPNGFRVVPASDRNAQSESVTGAWYPHWDLYVTRLFRRSGRSGDLRRWLGAVETALHNLGYAPEFLSMDPFENGDQHPYRHHGAANQMNAITAWYRAIVESVGGLECTPDGMRVAGPVLCSGPVSITGLHHLGTLWDVSIASGSGTGPSVTLDGRSLPYPFDVPRRAFHGGRHRIEIIRGKRG